MKPDPDRSAPSSGGGSQSLLRRFWQFIVLFPLALAASYAKTFPLRVIPPAVSLTVLILLLLCAEKYYYDYFTRTGISCCTCPFALLNVLYSLIYGTGVPSLSVPVVICFVILYGVQVWEYVRWRKQREETMVWRWGMRFDEIDMFSILLRAASKPVYW